MVCFNKSNLSMAIKMANFRGNFELTLRCVYLLVNKVAVLVSRVKGTNALRPHQREWLITNLPGSLLTTPPNLCTFKLQMTKGVMQTRCGLRQCFQRGLIAGHWCLRC